MLDVGVSGKFLFLHWNNVHIFRWICQHQTNLSVYHWKIWKGGQFLLLTLPMFVFDVLGKLWFSVGSYGNAESSWAQVWGPPSLGHWWLQEQYWYFSRKLCRGHFFLSGTFWLWWRVLWTREPSCPTMEWPRNENQLQLCVNNWVLSKTNAEQKQYSAI